MAQQSGGDIDSPLCRATPAQIPVLVMMRFKKGILPMKACHLFLALTLLASAASGGLA